MELHNGTQAPYAPYPFAHVSTDTAVPVFSSSSFDAADALDRLGGDAELFCDVADTLLQTQPLLFGEVGRAVARGDLCAIARAAHTLKGALLAVSALPAASLARAIEESARIGAAAPYAQWVELLNGELDHLYEELRAYIHTRRAA